MPFKFKYYCKFPLFFFSLNSIKYNTYYPQKYETWIKRALKIYSFNENLFFKSSFGGCFPM